MTTSGSTDWEARADPGTVPLLAVALPRRKTMMPSNAFTDRAAADAEDHDVVGALP